MARYMVSNFSKRVKMRRNPYQSPEQPLDFVATLVDSLVEGSTVSAVFAWVGPPVRSSSFIRGKQMKFGGAAAARTADRLQTVFFSAPVPSGCTSLMRHAVR